MFGKSNTADNKQKNTIGANQAQGSENSCKKPVFPAYVPSHLEVGNQRPDGANCSQQIYETNHKLMSLECRNRLYVTNLPPRTNMAEISTLFPECIGIALDVNDTSASTAAYLEFRDANSANIACQRNRGVNLRGNTLIISPKLKYT